MSEIESVRSEPVDMAGLSAVGKALRRARRCRFEFTQAGKQHRCWLEIGHQDYHSVNELGTLYWAHPLQGFGQSTEEFMAGIAKGEAIDWKEPGQTEEYLQGLPWRELGY